MAAGGAREREEAPPFSVPRGGAIAPLRQVVQHGQEVARVDLVDGLNITAAVVNGSRGLRGLPKV